jgi:hypothetical protein
MLSQPVRPFNENRRNKDARKNLLFFFLPLTIKKQALLALKTFFVYTTCWLSKNLWMGGGIIGKQCFPQMSTMR